MSNLNDIRPKPVPIVLDKERHLLYDLNAFAALEEEYGDIELAMNAFEKGSLKAIRTLIWAGLLHEDESLTVKDVGRMVTLADMAKIGEAVGKALEQAVPQSPKNAESLPEE